MGAEIANNRMCGKEGAGQMAGYGLGMNSLLNGNSYNHIFTFVSI